MSAPALEARLGLRLSALLSEGSEALPNDIATRLQFAREQAVERARQARRLQAAPAATVQGGASLALGGFGFGKQSWLRLASLLPLVALVAGLVLIQHEHMAAQIQVAADVDADLLGDDLPPSAYGDAGFVEYLKTPRN